MGHLNTPSPCSSPGPARASDGFPRRCSTPVSDLFVTCNVFPYMSPCTSSCLSYPAVMKVTCMHVTEYPCSIKCTFFKSFQLRCGEDMCNSSHRETRDGMKPCITTPSGKVIYTVPNYTCRLPGKPHNLPFVYY